MLNATGRFKISLTFGHSFGAIQPECRYEPNFCRNGQNQSRELIGMVNSVWINSRNGQNQLGTVKTSVVVEQFGVSLKCRHSPIRFLSPCYCCQKLSVSAWRGRGDTVLPDRPIRSLHLPINVFHGTHLMTSLLNEMQQKVFRGTVLLTSHHK